MNDNVAMDTLATALGITPMASYGNIPMPTVIQYDISNDVVDITSTANTQCVAITNTATPVIASDHPNDHLNRDTQFARENLYDVIAQTSAAANALAGIANESQVPRAYEVLGTLLKIQGEASKQLLDIHKVRKDVQPTLPQPNVATPNGGGTYIANAVFVGTNAELLDLINGKSHRIIEHDDMKED